MPTKSELLKTLEKYIRRDFSMPKKRREHCIRESKYLSKLEIEDWVTEYGSDRYHDKAYEKGFYARVPRNQETKGVVCGNCDHAFSSHELFVEPRKSVIRQAVCNALDCPCERYVEG